MGDNNSSAPPPPRPRSCVLIYSIEIRSDLSVDHSETINNPRGEPQVCSDPQHHLRTLSWCNTSSFGTNCCK